MAETRPVQLLTPAQAAAHLTIDIAQLDALRISGNGPEWGQWRGTIRYDVDELDQWLARRSS